jgi:hypothetical protein
VANAKREQRPAIGGLVDCPGPLVVRREGLTARTALDAFGRLVPGGRIFTLSKGAVSMADCVAWVLDEIGPADALLSTWTIAAEEISNLRQLLDTGRILRLRVLVDPSFVRRHPAYTAELRATFGAECLRLVCSHAKLAVLTNMDWAVTIQSSANLNRALRCESFSIEDNLVLSTSIVDTLGAWFALPAAWDVTAAEHRRRFEAWGADDRRPALAAAVADDAPYFGDGWADTDLRRVGLAYVK